MTRPRLREACGWIAATAVAAICVASCGGNPVATDSVPTPPDTTSQEVRAASTAPALSRTTTRPATTTTRPPTTTLPSITTVPPEQSSGWTALPPDVVSEKAFPPCCLDTWHGATSPDLAPAGTPLADGPYYVSMNWPEDLSEPLELKLYRFEQCGLLPEPACVFDNGTAAREPTELVVDRSSQRTEWVPLDDSVRVVVVGADGQRSREIEQATGSELAELAASVETAYRVTFADRFDAGDDPDDILADVSGNPTGGFRPLGHSAFVFDTPDGPPLLFGQAFPFDARGQTRTAGRGTDVLNPGDRGGRWSDHHLGVRSLLLLATRPHGLRCRRRGGGSSTRRTLGGRRR